MAQTASFLDEEHLQQLRRRSIETGRPLIDLVRDAYHECLRGRGIDPASLVIEPARWPPDEEWQARFDAVLGRLRAGLPPDLTSEEIEAEVAAVCEEVRQARPARAARSQVDKGPSRVPILAIFEDTLPLFPAGREADHR